MNDNIIINDFFENFPMENKNNYIIKIEQIQKTENENEFNTILSGINKNDNNDFLYIKQIKINGNENKLKQILKEVLFNKILKSQKYFSNDVSIYLSKNERYLYITIKENSISLSHFINSNFFHNLNNNELIKWIIYQIAFGLYFLHNNNIIHHDIKPSNILINSIGGISINGFGSSIFKGENSFSFSLLYSPPEFLIDNSNSDEKIDMWGLGVIMLELYSNQCPIFKNKTIKLKNEKNEHIKYLLSFFGLNENYSEESLRELLNEDKKTYIKLEPKLLEKIGDPEAIDLIKNLLVFNPRQRLSAEEVLKSNYLKKYNRLDSFDIQKIDFSKYKEIMIFQREQNKIFNKKQLLEFIKDLI